MFVGGTAPKYLKFSYILARSIFIFWRFPAGTKEAAGSPASTPCLATLLATTILNDQWMLFLVWEVRCRGKSKTFPCTALPKAQIRRWTTSRPSICSFSHDLKTHFSGFAWEGLFFVLPTKKYETLPQLHQNTP